jgi:hypothetical protein
MGVNKLWQVCAPSIHLLLLSLHIFIFFVFQLLEPASVRISFRHHVVKRGFIENIHGDRTLWVGIDAR